MSAQRLRDAAKVLRWRASFATPGPWEAFRRGDPEGPFGVTAEGLSDIGVDIFDGTPRKADAAYIATMHPGVALALADWLDSEADHPLGWSDHATTVADLILGESR